MPAKAGLPPWGCCAPRCAPRCPWQGPGQPCPALLQRGEAMPPVPLLPSLGRGSWHPGQGLGAVPEPPPRARERARAAGTHQQAVSPGAGTPGEQLSGSKAAEQFCIARSQPRSSDVRKCQQRGDSCSGAAPGLGTARGVALMMDCPNEPLRSPRVNTPCPQRCGQRHRARPAPAGPQGREGTPVLVVALLALVSRLARGGCSCQPSGCSPPCPGAPDSVSAPRGEQALGERPRDSSCATPGIRAWILTQSLARRGQLLLLSLPPASVAAVPWCPPHRGAFRGVWW